MKDEFYITIGVKETIPPMIVAMIVELVLEVKEKDYLQVFRIKPMNEYSILKLTQEVPEYEKSIEIGWIAPYKIKLFFMDNVLMLAEEY